MCYDGGMDDDRPDNQSDEGRVIAFRPEAPPLTADYVHYIQRRLEANLLSDQAAVDALRARDPQVTAERIQALLTQEGDA